MERVEFRRSLLGTVLSGAAVLVSPIAAYAIPTDLVVTATSATRDGPVRLEIDFARYTDNTLPDNNPYVDTMTFDVSMGSLGNDRFISYSFVSAERRSDNSADITVADPVLRKDTLVLDFDGMLFDMGEKFVVDIGLADVCTNPLKH